MTPHCLFCDIVSGTLAAPVVFQDDTSIAFLDHRPLFAGHCLLVPREHYETIGDLPADRVGPLFRNARILCMAVEQGLGAQGSFLAVNNRISQSVPHLHIHIVPRRAKDGLKGFFWPRGKYRDQSEADAVCSLLRDAVDRLTAGPRDLQGSVSRNTF